MKDNILFIYSDYDFRQPSAGATRMKYFAKAMADNNHKVFLVTCSSNKICDKNFTEIEPSVFLSCQNTNASNLYQVVRFLKELVSFAKNKSGHKTFFYYPSTLISLEIFSLLYLKLINNFRVFCDVNEVRKHSSAFHSPYKLSNFKYSIKKIIFKSVFTIMDSLLYFYDGITCISTSMEKYVKKYNKNTIRIPILTDPNHHLEQSNNIYYTEESFNIGFSGSIHPTKEDLENFISIINQLKNTGYNITFNLCGPIAREYRRSFLNTCNLNSVINYFGNLDSKELSTFLSQQDLLVIPRGYNLQNQFGFSTKLSNYLNHHKMVLVTDVSDHGMYIKDGINGFIVPPNSPNYMLKKLMYIIDNKEKLEGKIIRNAVFLAENELNYITYRSKLQHFIMNNNN